VRSARRQAREIALQALYAWQLSGANPLDEARSLEGYEGADKALAEDILRGVLERAKELEAAVAPHLSRQFDRLSPIERAILYIGAFELASHPETPFKVVLNEAIELGKSFGGNEGYRLVNGVLEKTAAALRPTEVGRARGSS
jgi:transcription antitermination protein NusB